MEMREKERDRYMQNEYVCNVVYDFMCVNAVNDETWQVKNGERLHNSFSGWCRVR